MKRLRFANLGPIRNESMVVVTLAPFVVWTGLDAVAAGAVASVSGFGIGSLLTPLLAPAIGAKLAVALIAIPHAFGTAYRFALMRSKVDRHVLLNFGVTSAIGGLIGALLHVVAPAVSLLTVFGALLVFVGAMGLFGLSGKLRFSGPMAWIAGALSGLLGGFVGNQGGIRSAALLGFDVDKEALVATATATGLIVDAARMPVYLATQGRQILALWPLVAIATLGVLLGTVAGGRLLRRIPESLYRKVLSVLLLALGGFMLAHATGLRI